MVGNGYDNSGHQINPNEPLNQNGFYARELNEVNDYIDAMGNKIPGLSEKYGYTYDKTTNTYTKK